eukprot:7375842-Prymnesium_polylepis.2
MALDACRAVLLIGHGICGVDVDDARTGHGTRCEHGILKRGVVAAHREEQGGHRIKRGLP